MAGFSARPRAVGITPLETRREVVVNLAARAEELGYTAFFVGEGWAQDAAVLLTEIALRTRRIRIGTGVLNVWGRSAASVAMLASSLAAVSGGRFDLGLGVGSPQLAEGLHDVAFQAPVERLGAVTRQVRRLLSGERMVPSFRAGESGSRPLRLGMRPAADIPIHLAGLGPQSIRLCGELADGWVPFLLPVSGLKDGLRLLEEGAARGPHGKARPRICPALPIAVSSDGTTAQVLASWWVSFYLTNMGPLYARSLRDQGFSEAVDAVLEAASDAGTVSGSAKAQVLLDELTVRGDESEARESLDSWYAAGADMPVLVLPPGRDQLELEYALDVLRPRQDAHLR